MRLRVKTTRTSVFIAVALAILVLGALAAAWLLAPQAHAAMHEGSLG
jgi:hypothetical protein